MRGDVVAAWGPCGLGVPVSRDPVCVGVCLQSRGSGGVLRPPCGVRDHAFAGVALLCVCVHGLGPRGPICSVSCICHLRCLLVCPRFWSVCVRLRAPPYDLALACVDVL